MKKYYALLKAGYYLKPCTYKDGTVYEIVKDLHPVNCNAHRKLFGTVNTKTGEELKKLIGFVVKQSTNYFGNKPKIETGMILQ